MHYADIVLLEHLQVVCFFIGPGRCILSQYLDIQIDNSFATRQVVRNFRNAASGRMVTDFVMYDHTGPREIVLIEKSCDKGSKRVACGAGNERSRNSVRELRST